MDLRRPATAQTHFRTCVRCGATVGNRRALIPKFCPECGQVMSPSPMWRHDHATPQRRADGSLSSLILGLFALCAPPLGGLFGLFAIMVGLGAQKEIRHSGGRLGGAGLAKAGVILGALGVLLSIMWCGRIH